MTFTAETITNTFPETETAVQQRIAASTETVDVVAEIAEFPLIGDEPMAIRVDLVFGAFAVRDIRSDITERLAFVATAAEAVAMATDWAGWSTI